MSIHSPGVLCFWLGFIAVCVFLLAIEAGYARVSQVRCLEERLWLDIFADKSVEKLRLGKIGQALRAYCPCAIKRSA